VWPHSLQLGIGETAVCVGTDDAAIAAQLAPWALVDDPSVVAPELVDFGLELHPARPAHRAAPRTLPNLRHGTTVIGRGGDVAALSDGLLRTLGSFLSPLPAGCLRLSGLPLLRDGAVELAPPDVADHLSSRWLQARGLQPLHVASVVVDPATLEVHIDAPLGSPDASFSAPLRRWWCALPDPDAELGGGRFLAHLAHRLSPPTTTVDDDRVGDALSALVCLVERLPPERIGYGSDDLIDRLAAGRLA
jgi:hypothetical protein